MKTPATDSLAALSASLRIVWTSAPAWILPVALLSVIGELPEAWLRYSARGYYAELTAGGGMEPLGVQALAMAGLIGLMFSLTMQLVAVAWGFLVISEVAAGRPAGIAEGLRRTLAWRLQLSWLVSAFLVSTAHRLWFIGGCFLLLPFGFAPSDAYERATGMSAISRAGKLGFSVGPHGGKLGVPMAIVSTGLLLATAVIDTVLSTVNAMLSPAVNLGGLTDLVTRLTSSPGSAVDLLGAVVMAILPEPSVAGVALTLLEAPWPVLAQIVVFAVPVVVYHDAMRIDAARERPVLDPT